MADSLTTLIRRAIRKRYGITADRIRARSELPWFWRVPVYIIGALLIFHGADWVFDAGRRIAGYHHQQAESELAGWRTQAEEAQANLASAKERVNALESQLEVETATATELRNQLTFAQRESMALKEELALFEKLVAEDSPSASGLKVPRVSLERTADGKRLRYRILVVNQNTSRFAKDVSLDLQFELKTVQGGRSVIIFAPDKGASSIDFRLTFKHLYRTEGEISVPQEATIESAELRLLQDGAVKLRQAIPL